ncbi:SdiA-regulated domain-containing protein [Pseudomonas sp. KNUC1026]|uniref:SdiA-regulated domain-containing protein n=1 Tax=Pseudomonas sp. KNUC1026 TaxID=2893890 RepID=UPI001F27432B|nr:SdiA-regulated domain-containing protein [Pseudomonas sp. KNUC1026]UFH49575.1 SdiA-regulated domain-containing protein [Pseudomonas sp. KNUC1026]
MARLSSLHRWLVLLALFLITLAAVGQHFRWFERGWFNLVHWLAPAEHALGLADYRVVVEGEPLAGVPSDVSALTYHTERKTLFTITNQRPEVIELSLQGEVLRRVPVQGIADPEAIEYIAGDTFVVTDEREQQLVRIEVGEGALAIDASTAPRLSLGLGRNGNKGFEGLAYDRQGQRLYVAKERDPMRIFEVEGFAEPGFAGSVHIQENPERDARLFVRDLSSLQFDEVTGHLLALSDESRLVLEIDTSGQVVGSLALHGGASGLLRAVPQAEGMALDEQGTLYLVSEPNLFYVFRKPSTP